MLIAFAQRTSNCIRFSCEKMCETFEHAQIRLYDEFINNTARYTRRYTQNAECDDIVDRFADRGQFFFETRIIFTTELPVKKKGEKNGTLFSLRSTTDNGERICRTRARDDGKNDALARDVYRPDLFSPLVTSTTL